MEIGGRKSVRRRRREKKNRFTVRPNNARTDPIVSFSFLPCQASESGQGGIGSDMDGWRVKKKIMGKIVRAEMREKLKIKICHFNSKWSLIKLLK